MRIDRQAAAVLIAAVAIVGGLAFAIAYMVDQVFPSSSGDAPKSASTSLQNDASDNLRLVVGGIPRTFANGDQVPLSGDVVAKINVERGDERYSRRVDLYLYHQSSSLPADDVTVQIKGEMLYMEHGTFRVVPLQSDGGHYILLLPFIMPGEWQVDLQINVSGRQTEVQLLFDLFE